MATTTKKGQLLYRSETNSMIGGVCGGIGEYFDIDPSIIRIAFVLLAVFGGTGLIIYLIMWVVIPSEKDLYKPHKESIKNNSKEIENRVEKFASGIEKNNSRTIFGIFLLVIGALLLIDTAFGINLLKFERLWPLFIIAIGILLLTKNAKKE